MASTLDPNSVEKPEAIIQKYLSGKFFDDHMQAYKNRPIYWKFSSGEMKAFECLVYLHRYTEGTLARMRIDYVIPLQGNISAMIDQIARDLEGTTSTARRKELEKRRQKLIAKLAELRVFDAKLHHLADQRITLDLDDGVKVNYAKFGDLLAEVKAVTGGVGD
jgi:type II restriction/modification system DNA methylase subunit YeeA